MTKAELHKERDGGNSPLASTVSSIKQQYRKTFCTLKHTRSSYYPTIDLVSVLSLDASSEMHEGKDLALVVGGGMVRGENSCGWGQGVTRAELHKERDGGNSTTDSSIRQQYCTTFYTLKHTRSIY